MSAAQRPVSHRMSGTAKKYLAVACKIPDRGKPGSREVRIGKQGGGVRAEQQNRAERQQRKQRTACRESARGRPGKTAVAQRERKDERARQQQAQQRPELRQERRCRCGKTREPQLTCGQHAGQHRDRPCQKHRRQRPHRADVQSAQRVRKGAERQRETEHPQRHARKHGRAEKAAHARERAHERKERCEREQELHARPRRDSAREACRSGGEQSGRRTGRRCGVERLRVRREVEDLTERQEREQRAAPSGEQSVRQSARLRSCRRRESSSVFLP